MVTPKKLRAEEAKSSQPAEPIPCSECSVGLMRATQVAYFTWLGDEMISVPDFPAWVCDICGRREYDVRALSQLSILLSPNLGKPALRKTARVQPKREGKRKGARPAARD